MASATIQQHSAIQQGGMLRLSAVVFTAALLPYISTLSSAWTGTDDTQLIIEDARYLSSDGAITAAFHRPFFPADGKRQHYYRPLVAASFVMDASPDAPPSPPTFHRTNVVLHVATSLLLFALGLALQIDAAIAGAAAALFAVHPVTAETVAWIPGRCDGLMAVFALGAIIAWVRFDRIGSRRWLVAHVACFAAALFSKEAAIVIPLIALSYSLLVTRERRRPRDAAVWVGWAAAFGLWFALRSSAVGSLGLTVTSQTALQAVPVLLVSFGKLLVPAHLGVLATLRDSSVAPGLVAVVALAAVARWLKGMNRALFVWAAVVLPVLTLSSTLLVSDYLILDNRLYLPLGGLAIGVAVALRQWATNLSEPRQVLAPGWALTVVLLAVLTVHHARAFASPRAFCEAAVEGSPHLGLARVNLGGVDYLEGKLDAAERRFREALEQDPNEPIAHSDLGLIYMNRGDLARAEQELEAELRINPSYPKAHFNLGLVLSRTGRDDAAREHFERVVQMVPGDTQAWGELLKYWAQRDAKRATEISERMEALGVRFESASPFAGPASP